MLVLSAKQIRALAPLPNLIECLQDAFRAERVAPARQVARMPGGTGERLFLSMPAFDCEGGGAVKLTTLFPDNQAKGLPTIQAAIVCSRRLVHPWLFWTAPSLRNSERAPRRR